MKPVDFASIVVRGVALWLLIESVAGLSAVFQQWHENAALRAVQVRVLIFAAVLPIATAAIVWANADWLATRVAAAEPSTSAGPAWTSSELLRLAIAIVGLATLTRSLSELAWHASVFVTLNAARGSLLDASTGLRAEFASVSSQADLISALARTAAGAFLVLKPGRVASMVGPNETADKAASTDELV